MPCAAQHLEQPFVCCSLHSIVAAPSMIFFQPAWCCSDAAQLQAILCQGAAMIERESMGQSPGPCKHAPLEEGSQQRKRAQAGQGKQARGASYSLASQRYLPAESLLWPPPWLKPAASSLPEQVLALLLSCC